jgi:alanyl-tRNA synthetase
VTVSYLSMSEAVAAGADAFFDEKYGERVRTVRVEGFSHELCGGTHCANSGQVGSFVIVGERSIGSGMRRIEALTGDGADAWFAARLATLERATDLAGAKNPDALPDRIAALETELREAQRRLKARSGAGLLTPARIADEASNVAPDVRLVVYAGAYLSMEDLRAAAKEVRAVLNSGVIAMVREADEPELIVTVSDDLIARGISAGEIVRSVAPAFGGRGGGRADIGQARGTERSGIPGALGEVRAAVEGQLARGA